MNGQNLTASLRSTDLNLLVALQAILKRRNVSRAAEDMGVTQPAMSNTLSRIRELFDDQILVRGPTGFVLTKRAQELEKKIGATLEGVAALFSAQQEFDPLKSDRVCALSVTDYAEATVVPKIIEAFGREAPNCRLSIRKIPAYTPYEALANGDLELCIAYSVSSHAGLKVLKLRSDRFVCIARKNHPLIGKTLSLERYLQLSHALVNPVAVSPEDEFTGLVDDLLKKTGASRRVVVSIPDFHLATKVAAASDYVVTLAEGLVEVSAEKDRISVYPCPVKLHAFETNLLWHERSDSDPALRWFRRLIGRVSK